MPTGTKITQLPETTDVRVDALVPLSQLVDGLPATVAARVSRLRAATVLRGLPGKQIEDEFGNYMNYTGDADMAEVINDCIVQYTAQGNPVMIGAGNYLNDSSIILVDNAQVLLSQKATLVKSFSTLGVGGHITQASFTSAISNVVWRGGVIRNPNPATLTGNPFSLNINNSELSDFFADDWANTSRFMLLFGKGNRISNFKAYSPVQTGGGLWCGRAEGNIISNGDIRCDDDAYMWNIGVQGNFVGGVNRFNEYVGCYGESRSGHLLTVACSRSGVLTIVDGEIYGNVAVNMTGRCRLGLAIYNTLADKAIRDLSIVNFAVDNSGGIDGNLAPLTHAVELIGGNDTGGVHNIELTNLYMQKPLAGAMRVRGFCTDIKVRGGHFEAPRTAGISTVQINNVLEEESGLSSVSFDGTRIDGVADADVVRIGSDNLERVRVDFRGVRITNIGDGKRGIIVLSTGGGIIGDRCTFEEASGATTARAILIQAESSNLTIERNDYSNISNNAPLILQWPFDDDSNALLNESIISISTNRTTYVHESGTTFLFTAAGTRTLSLPAPAAQVRFTVTQTGAGAARIKAGAGDTIKIGSSASTAGGYIESTAVGDSVTLVALDADTWVATSFTGTWTAA